MPIDIVMGTTCTMDGSDSNVQSYDDFVFELQERFKRSYDTVR